MKTNFPKIPLVISALLFIFFMLACLFMYREITLNNQKAETEMEVWQTETARREDLRSLARSLQMIEEERFRLDTHFAKSSDVVPFLNTIEKLAPQAGATAEVSAVDTLLDKTGLIVGLKAAGSFKQLYTFLTLLENSPYELDFLSVDFHKASSGAVGEKDAKSAAWEAIFRIQLLSFVP